MFTFSQGQRYTRADIRELAGQSRTGKGGKWDTGIFEHEGESFIFANVGTAGRTGHDYGNWWEDTRLRWSHRGGSHLGWRSVQELVRPGRSIHVFWREENTAPFDYAGLATPLEIANTTPVEILWCFDSRDGLTPANLVLNPEELPAGFGGEDPVYQVSVDAHERNPVAHQACVVRHGNKCSVCGLCFKKRYGAVGRGFIEIHHLEATPRPESGQALDPVDDLRPVCPNCHAMLHRRRPPLSLCELRAMLR